MRYSEANGKKPFNWFAYLDFKINGGECPKDPNTDLPVTHTYASALAMSWVTCAVGNTCDALPRKLVIAESTGKEIPGVPVDKELSKLGCKFSERIDNAQWEKALKTLNKIEARSTLLLTEMGVICPTPTEI